MEIVKPESVDNVGRIRRSTTWFGVFTDHNGVPRQLKLLANRKQSVYLGELLDELIHVHENVGSETESPVELLTLLPPKSIRQLIDWGLVDFRQARLGTRLVDDVNDFAKDAAEDPRQNRIPIPELKERLIGFFLAMRWYVWKDVDVSQAQTWFHALPKYGDRWDRDARPREDGKVTLNAFIAFAGWMAKQHGLPENPAQALKALTLSEEEEERLERQRRELRRQPPRRLRRPKP